MKAQIKSKVVVSFKDYYSSPCTKRSHPAEKTLMPLRELSHAPLACARVNSRTLAGGQS